MAKNLDVSYKSFVPDILRQFNQQASIVVKKTAFDVESGWKARAPVRTGKYRASIRTEQADELESVVGSPEIYGPFLEYGTRKMAAKPSATPAAEAEAENFNRAMINIANKIK